VDDDKADFYDIPVRGGPLDGVPMRFATGVIPPGKAAFGRLGHYLLVDAGEPSQCYEWTEVTR
jgi:hypothetical protein